MEQSEALGAPYAGAEGTMSVLVDDVDASGALRQSEWHEPDCSSHALEQPQEPDSVHG